MEKKELNPAFIFINQHNLTEDLIQSINLSNYKLITALCRKAHRGGGVAAFMRQDLNLNITKVNLEDFNEETSQEFIGLSFTSLKFKVVIIGAYRSPNAANSANSKNKNSLKLWIKFSKHSLKIKI